MSVLRWTGFMEGVSALLLFFVAMPLKYLADRPEAVSVVGLAHGVLFIAYVGLLVLAHLRNSLPLKLVIYGFFAAFVPFGPFVIDGRIARFEKERACPSSPRSGMIALFGSGNRGSAAWSVFFAWSPLRLH